MKEILINVKENEKELSQALKVVSLDNKDYKFLILNNPSLFSYFTSYSSSFISIDKDKKTTTYFIKDKREETNKGVNFNIFKSFNKKFILVSSSTSFDDFFKLNQKLNEKFYIFNSDEKIKNNQDIINDKNYEGETSLNEIFYDDKHLILVSSYFLSLFNEFIFSLSNYFLKRDDKDSSKKDGYLASLFKWKPNEVKEKPLTLNDDLTCKYVINFNNDELTLYLNKDNNVNSLMSSLYLFISFIENKIDFIKHK